MVLNPTKLPSGPIGLTSILVTKNVYITATAAIIIPIIKCFLLYFMSLLRVIRLALMNLFFKFCN